MKRRSLPLRGTLSRKGRVPACLVLWLICLGFLCVPASSQIPAVSQTRTAAQPEVPKDALGRTTPKGTVLGFLGAARRGNDEIAAQYLNTRLRREKAEELAHQLYVVLNRPLPARLIEINDTPEGSATDLPNPNQELVGVVKSARGETNIVLERVNRGKDGQIWLFSSQTLNSIPGIYEEITRLPLSKILPKWMVNTRFADTPLYEWLTVLLGIPLVYFLTGLLGLLIRLLVNLVRRMFRVPVLPRAQILPAPARLILLGLVIRWMLYRFRLPLLARQFWFTVAAVIFIAAATWLLILFTGWLEARAKRSMQSRNLAGATSMLRLARGVVSVLVLFAGLLVALHHFGVDLTAALAGLGVGGIAVALAAQKTLENLIGGASLIFDRAMQVGDFVRIGDSLGTVEEFGLRSTRVRTLDRTVLRVPNGQLASVTLESYSARDKFWLHPILRLKYGITSRQLHAVLDGIRRLLDRTSTVEPASSRVRLLNFAASCMEIEVFAYVDARDWSGFLELQEELLLGMMECIEAAGAEIALPSQTVFLESGPAARDGSEPPSEISSPEKKAKERPAAAKSA